MNRFFIYARKSTDEVHRQVRSIEAQLEELRELAHKESLTVVDELIESQTAKHPGRPIFNAMLKRIENGEANGILAWHPDRLARNSVDGGQVIYLIDTGKLGGLRFPTFWFEPTPQGKFMLNLAFGQSKYYVDNLSENIRRGFRTKARKGIWPNGAHLGYQTDPITKVMKLDSARAPLIRRAFEMYSTGNYSFKEVLEFFVANRFDSRRGVGKLSLANIQYILTNPIYYGLVRWEGEDFEGVHEPLITKDLFDRVQQMMVVRSSGTAKKRRNLKPILFRGVFKCGTCGAGVTATIQKGHTYYHCCRSKGFCVEKYVREESLKEQVMAELKPLAVPSDWADNIINELKTERAAATERSDAAARATQTQIADLDKTIERLLDAYLAGDVSREEYHKKRTDLMGLKMDLKEKLGRRGLAADKGFEPAIEFVNWAKELNKDVFGGHWRALVPALQKATSNRKIIAQKLLTTVAPPYSLWRENEAARRWWSCRELHPGPRSAWRRHYKRSPLLGLTLISVANHLRKGQPRCISVTEAEAC